MAAVGGSRKESAKSQEHIEFKCDPCNRDGIKNMAAKSYCRDCGENICSVCIDIHRRFSSMQSHNMTSCSTTVSEKGSTIRVVGKPSHVGQFHIQVSGEMPSVICGITFLDDGTVVLTDFNNKSLNVLDDTYSIMKHCDLPGEPVGVCATGPHEVCVAMKEMKYVQFVNTKPRMDTTRVIYVGTSCWDVASRDGVYVLCGNNSRYDLHLEVRVYSRAGELRRTCNLAGEWQCMLARLAVSGDGSRIHVATDGYGVITCNQQGDVLWKCTAEGLQYDQGMCIGDDNHVYVCGSDDNVVQLDSEGNKVRDLLTKDDGIPNPSAVCYDAETRLLVVAATQYMYAGSGIMLYVFQM